MTVVCVLSFVQLRQLVTCYRSVVKLQREMDGILDVLKYIKLKIFKSEDEMTNLGDNFTQNISLNLYRLNNKCSAVAEMGDRLATIDMGRKLGDDVPLFGGRELAPI